jgi:tetratricopeptide (TPR) repeat protein
LTYAGLGRWQEAIEPYRQAFHLKPDFVEALYNLAAAFHKLGRYRDEIVTWKDAIRVKPDSALAHNNLGVAYGKLGRYREEIRSCKQAVKIKPDLAVAHYNLAVSYLMQGDRHSSREEGKALESLDSSLAQELRDWTASQYTMRVSDASSLNKRSTFPAADSLPSAFDETTVGMTTGKTSFPVTDEIVNQSQADAMSAVLHEALTDIDQRSRNLTVNHLQKLLKTAQGNYTVRNGSAKGETRDDR